jgi:acetylserotonin N-methyltransferase
VVSTVFSKYRIKNLRGRIVVVTPTIVLDLILAFRRSKTMFAAVKLGIFDCLATGPKTLATLATQHQEKLNEDALERLLDACVGLKLLKHHDGKYENTDVAKNYLCKESPTGLTGYINCSNDAFWKLWGNLEDAVTEGTNRWKQTFNIECDYWKGFYRTKEDLVEFLMGMHGYGQITSPHVVRAFDLSKFEHLVDVGGGTGHLAIEACRAYAGLNATVFDLEEASPLARTKIAEAGLLDRINVVDGDFFVDPLPKGDVYVFARTLHDWPEARVIELMIKVREAIPPNGLFLIAEAILKEDRSGPEYAQLQNLNMLTIADGKERTFEQYAELLKEKAGFKYVEQRPTDSPLDVIVAHNNVAWAGPGSGHA